MSWLDKETKFYLNRELILRIILHLRKYLILNWINVSLLNIRLCQNCNNMGLNCTGTLTHEFFFFNQLLLKIRIRWTWNPSIWRVNFVYSGSTGTTPGLPACLDLGIHRGPEANLLHIPRNDCHLFNRHAINLYDWSNISYFHKQFFNSIS